MRKRTFTLILLYFGITLFSGGAIAYGCLQGMTPLSGCCCDEAMYIQTCSAAQFCVQRTVPADYVISTVPRTFEDDRAGLIPHVINIFPGDTPTAPAHFTRAKADRFREASWYHDRYTYLLTERLRI